jgi:hypothetical protein
MWDEITILQFNIILYECKVQWIIFFIICTQFSCCNNVLLLYCCETMPWFFTRFKYLKFIIQKFFVLFVVLAWNINGHHFASSNSCNKMYKNVLILESSRECANVLLNFIISWCLWSFFIWMNYMPHHTWQKCLTTCRCQVCDILKSCRDPMKNIYVDGCYF